MVYKLQTNDMERYMVEFRLSVSKEKRRFEQANMSDVFERILINHLPSSQALEERKSTLTIDQVGPSEVKQLESFLDHVVDKCQREEQLEMIQDVLRKSMHNSRRKIVVDIRTGTFKEPLCFYCGDSDKTRQSCPLSTVNIEAAPNGRFMMITNAPATLSSQSQVSPSTVPANCSQPTTPSPPVLVQNMDTSPPRINCNLQQEPSSPEIPMRSMSTSVLNLRQQESQRRAIADNAVPPRLRPELFEPHISIVENGPLTPPLSAGLASQDSMNVSGVASLSLSAKRVVDNQVLRPAFEFPSRAAREKMGTPEKQATNVINHVAEEPRTTQSNSLQTKARNTNETELPLTGSWTTSTSSSLSSSSTTEQQTPIVITTEEPTLKTTTNASKTVNNHKEQEKQQLADAYVQPLSPELDVVSDSRGKDDSLDEFFAADNANPATPISCQEEPMRSSTPLAGDNKNTQNNNGNDTDDTEPYHDALTIDTQQSNFYDNDDDSDSEEEEEKHIKGVKQKKLNIMPIKTILTNKASQQLTPKRSARVTFTDPSSPCKSTGRTRPLILSTPKPLLRNQRNRVADPTSVQNLKRPPTPGVDIYVSPSSLKHSRSIKQLSGSRMGSSQLITSIQPARAITTPRATINEEAAQVGINPVLFQNLSSTPQSSSRIPKIPKITPIKTNDSNSWTPTPGTSTSAYIKSSNSQTPSMTSSQAGSTSSTKTRIKRTVRRSQVSK